MDDRNIDIQVIGPRPFIVLGWMEPHLLPSWTTFFNDCIKKQCDFFPDRFIGAATLPQISEAPDLQQLHRARWTAAPRSSASRRST